jgi:hypothetical protein
MADEAANAAGPDARGPVRAQASGAPRGAGGESWVCATEGDGGERVRWIDEEVESAARPAGRRPGDRAHG